MKKIPEYFWDEKNKVATCVIHYKSEQFVGVAKCHYMDEDFESERTGQHIAYIRAYVKYLKFIKKTESVPAFNALNHLYSTVKNSPRFNPEGFEASRLLKEIKNAQSDIDTLNDLIEINEKDLRYYIAEKDKLHEMLRKKSAQGVNTD